MQDTVKTDTKEEVVIPVNSNPFADESWGNEEPLVPVKEEEKVVEEKIIDKKEEEKVEIEKEEEKIVEEKKPEFKYENEVSEKIHKALLEGKDDDVYEFLDKKKKLEKLTTAEVDVNIAEEIVKLSIKNKYPDLTDAQVNHRFNKLFPLQQEPVMEEMELQEEFDKRKSEWKQAVKDRELDLIIEGKTAKPEIEKLKAELKLPNINKEEGIDKQPTQEELEQAKTYLDNFLKTVESSVNSVDGFNVEYKDEDVTLQSAYSLSKEEKTEVAAKIKTFAEENFNANAIFAERWVNKDNTLNTSQMVKDLSLLQSSEKIMQKLVNDSVAQRLVEYRKSTSNIKVTGESKGTFTPNADKDDKAKMAEFFFSET